MKILSALYRSCTKKT